MRGHIEVARLLLDGGADVNSSSRVSDMKLKAIAVIVCVIESVVIEVLLLYLRVYVSISVNIYCMCLG